MTASVVMTCLLMAAQSYGLPPAVMVGIMKAEGGAVGQQVRNTNGSYDLGPMQINTIWVPELAAIWGVDQATAMGWIRDDACTNMKVSAWILKNHFLETRDMKQAIAHYHSRTPHIGARYRQRVVRIMDESGLLKR